MSWNSMTIGYELNREMLKRIGIENIRNIEIDVRKGRPKPGFY